MNSAETASLTKSVPTPATEVRKSWQLWYLIHLMIHATSWLLILASVPVIAAFYRMFEEFQLDLPAPTILAARIAQSLVRWWWLYSIVFLTIDASVLFALHTAPRSWRGVRWAWVAAVPVMTLLYWLWFGMAIALPASNFHNSFSRVSGNEVQLSGVVGGSKFAESSLSS